MNDLVGIDNPLTDLKKGKIEQGGIGFYSLCSECNNFLGRTYVKAYQKWAIAGQQILSQGEFGPNVRYQIIEQEPSKVIKQILSMFLAINADWYRKAYPELVAFVKDPNSKDLPEKYKLYVYLNKEGKPRYAQHAAQYTGELGAINCTEIAFPPFGYLLTFDYQPGISFLTNITTFKDHDGPEEIAIGLNVLPTHLPFIALDYRTREQLEIEIAEQVVIKNELIKQGKL